MKKFLFLLATSLVSLSLRADLPDIKLQTLLSGVQKFTQDVYDKLQKVAPSQQYTVGTCINFINNFSDENAIEDFMGCLKAGIPSDAFDPRDSKKETMLHALARYRGHGEISFLQEALRSNNANLDVQNSDGDTPLHIVLKNANGNDRRYEDLLSATNINIKNKAGQTPLYLALKGEEYAAAEFLINNGADITISDNTGMTPLQLAQSLSNSDNKKKIIATLEEKLNEKSSHLKKEIPTQQISSLLLSLINLVANTEYSSQLAVQIKGYIDANVRPDKLVPTGATHEISKNVNGAPVKETVDGQESALHWIALNKSAPENIAGVMDVVLQAPNININVQNSYGQTPLYLAAQNTNNAALDKLLAAKADPNIESISGTTPLHIAAEKGNIEGVKKLLGKGAKTDIKNIYGSNAIGSAQRSQGDKGTREEIIKLLQQAAQPSQQTQAASQATAAPDKQALDVLNTLVQKSDSFNNSVGRFPTTSNRIKNICGNDLVKKETVAKQAQNAYPLMHNKVTSLMNDFLTYKKLYGSDIEKALYATMNINDFINRLLTQRPLTFYLSSDNYLLKGGGSGIGGFEAIGTESEKSPLLLENYLSYDEMQISALLGVSTPTYFINNGNRYNAAIPGAAGSYQETGIYMGLVGARLEKENVMEWQHVVITPEQNTLEKGYGLTSSKPVSHLTVWEKLYGVQFPTYQEAEQDKSGEYVRVNGFSGLINKDVYKKRIRLTIAPFLFDAQKRGEEVNKQVYLRPVALGLGNWTPRELQKPLTFLMLEVYRELINELALTKITDIEFLWFDAQMNLSKNGLTVKYTQGNPADKLQGEDSKKLLVSCFAWDGNSYPGNEYWLGIGSLGASGDPAAICCSTVAELQNPLINEHVSAKNLKSYG